MTEKKVRPKTKAKPKAETKTERFTYSEEMMNRICAEISSGKSLVQVAQMKDMPGRPTIYYWLREHPEFQNSYDVARDERADKIADEILDIADTEKDHQKARNRIDARKWLAARMSPRKYGDRQQIDMRHDLTNTETAELVLRARQAAERLGIALPPHLEQMAKDEG